MALTDWQGYQQAVADLFSGVGLSVATNERVEGVRTSHNVDVVVRGEQAGIKQLWLVECKKWNRRISKDTVLTLRSIVSDTGADRGFMMAESGYQSGAFEATRHTNITLTSIADLNATLAEERGNSMLRSILERVETCRERYWAMSKTDRIALGLRPEVGFVGYSSVQVMSAVKFTAGYALRRGFPIRYDKQLAAFSSTSSGRELECGADEEGALANSTALSEVLEAEIGELEGRLDRAESALLGQRDR